MNNNTDPQRQESTAMAVYRWVFIGVAVIMFVGVVVAFLWPVPEGAHCSEAQGNATCIGYYRGNRPYCTKSGNELFKHGCVVMPPPEELAKPCGQLKEGLPDDPTCSQVVVDNPPDPEFIEKFQRREQLVEIAYAVAVGVLLIGGWALTTGRRVLRDRARAARSRRAQQLDDSGGPGLEQPLATDNQQGHQSPPDEAKEL